MPSVGCRARAFFRSKRDCFSGEHSGQRDPSGSSVLISGSLVSCCWSGRAILDRGSQTSLPSGRVTLIWSSGLEPIAVDLSGGLVGSWELLGLLGSVWSSSGFASGFASVGGESAVDISNAEQQQKKRGRKKEEMEVNQGENKCDKQVPPGMWRNLTKQCPTLQA